MEARKHVALRLGYTALGKPKENPTHIAEHCFVCGNFHVKPWIENRAMKILGKYCLILEDKSRREIQMKSCLLFAQ